MLSRARVLALALPAALAAGCGGGGYVYAPEGATTTSDGYPASRIAIPPERPTGDIEIASFGLARLDAGKRIDALHVRLVVENLTDSVPWTIDTREQMIDIPGAGRSRPILVNTDQQTLPIVSVEPRGRRVLDLYFPTPSGGADEPPRFDLVWQVGTGERLVAQRSTFDQLSTQPEYVATWPYSTWNAGWGPVWWHDPYYAHGGFADHHPIVLGDHHPHVSVMHAPSGHFGVSHHGGGHMVSHGGGHMGSHGGHH